MVNFWRQLLQNLNIQTKLSSAHHPQTNGSTEVVNQVLEQYLCIFISYQQDDWTKYLPLAEFTYNNSLNAQMGLTPFYADNGMHPIFDPMVIHSGTVPSADECATEIMSNISELWAMLLWAQEDYSHYAN